MILTSKYIVPNGYLGITLFPFVFVKDSKFKMNKYFLNHEQIHLRQQMEMLVIPFFIWYGIEFLVRYVQYKNWFLAYRNISFEREAYYKEKNLNYLKSRSFWSFLKFMSVAINK
jgi:hypothetical protein